MPFWAKPMFRKGVKKSCYGIGVGRHSNEEVEEMMKHDLRMLSELLGNCVHLFWPLLKKMLLRRKNQGKGEERSFNSCHLFCSCHFQVKDESVFNLKFT